MTVSNVDHLFHWNVTAFQYSLHEQWCFCPPWHKLKLSILVEAWLFCLQPLTNRHFIFPVEGGKTGHRYQCSRGLCAKKIIHNWNNLGKFNVRLTSHFGHFTCWIYICAILQCCRLPQLLTLENQTTDWLRMTSGLISSSCSTQYDITLPRLHVYSLLNTFKLGFFSRKAITLSYISMSFSSAAASLWSLRVAKA